MTQDSLLSDYIILNSISHTQRALELTEGKYGLIELYLDNDKSGDRSEEKKIWRKEREEDRSSFCCLRKKEIDLKRWR